MIIFMMKSVQFGDNYEDYFDIYLPKFMALFQRSPELKKVCSRV